MTKHIFTFISLSLLLTGCMFKTEPEDVPLIPRHVLFGPPEKTCVRISPDGKTLAYVAPVNRVPNVWIKTIGKNDDQSVTQDARRGIQDFRWAKNNESIFFRQDNNGDENWHLYKTDLKTRNTVDLTPFKGVSVRNFILSKHMPDEVLVEMNKENPKCFDVYRLDGLSGALECVTKNPGDIDIWLADSNLRVRAAVVAKPDGSSELLVRDEHDSSWKRRQSWPFDDSMVGSFPPTGSRPISFSRDGNFLYLIDSTDANTKSLVKMDLDSNEKETLFSDEQYDIDSVVISDDTGEPDLISFVRARRHWKAINPDYKKDLATVLSIEKGDLTYVDRSTDDRIWVVGFDHDDGPLAYYLYDRQTKKSEFLFYDRQALKNYTLASMKPFSFTARDGLTIHGYMTCPPGKPVKNLPMVLDVHGGPWWRHEWGYANKVHNIMAQLLANRGYVCLQVNFRGSSGYGKKFLNAGDKQWGGKMHDDLVDAVKWAINRGIADQKRIAIFGQSYGGYAALVGATFTPDVFCCAVDFWGPSNLSSIIKSIVSFRETGRAKWHRRVGNPETDGEFLKSRSPLFYVDRIKIPVFIAQGGNDPRVKQSESEQIVEAMKDKGISYQYMLFPDEGHGVRRPQNMFKLSVAFEKFLAKHLGGRFEE